MSFLAQNPGCQERARQEAVGALGTKGYLDFKDAGQLPYITVSTHRACAAPRAALHPLAPILSPRPLPHTHDLPTDTNTHLSIHLFMQACLRETLRLYSAVAAFQRECVKETIIKASDGKKYKFHAGQKVSTRSRARKHAFLQY